MNIENIDESNKVSFYSQNWKVARVLAVSIPSRVDILITEQFLYLISLPESLAHNIVGIFSLLGLLVARSAEKKVHNKFRSGWLDSNNKIISREYEKKYLP